MPDSVTSSPAKSAAGSEQWPSEAADFVVRTVGTVRDKTTGPAIKGARAAVFGMFAALVGLALLVLFAIALVRVITVYMPHEKVWPADLIVGGVFSVAGIALWTRTRARP
ncbi:MAG TPA: hypothetical protein VHA73_14150 [Acidimicrobiales bacterium]|jgi:hypothetical protein|nr:hypothetical protein [Acidimicrobiales bacterium]